MGGIEVAGVVGCRAGSGGERRAEVRRGCVGLELPANFRAKGVDERLSFRYGTTSQRF